MKRTNKFTRAEMIQEQKDWIERCGGSLAGYIERYGSKDDLNHYGDGGEAIYRADTNALKELEGR